MRFWTIVKVGLRSLLANKVRSFLAMLGIIIGVGAVIALVGIGTGAKKAVVNQISALGTNLLIVRPAQAQGGGVTGGTRQNLSLSDAAALTAVPGIVTLSPVSSGGAQVKYMGRNTRTRIVGAAPTYVAIRGYEFDKGRIFTEAEVDRNARVALIGSVTAGNLFDEDFDPVGEVVKINSINFRIIGVFQSKGDTGFFNMDDLIVVPYTTGMKQLFGRQQNANTESIGEIDIQAQDNADLAQVQDDITQAMRRRHRLFAEDAYDFELRNQADMIQRMSQVAVIMTWVLGAAAAISLFVGGIGIMNIMLVTVTERTREIGVRKAIGAREATVLVQFLLESIVVCGIGGLLGIGLGLLTVWVLPKLSDIFAPTVEIWAVILAVGLSGVVGVLAGIYPAWRAARLDPVEALRYE